MSDQQTNSEPTNTMKTNETNDEQAVTPIADIALLKLGKDLRALAGKMPREEAQNMIRVYYDAQHKRMRNSLQSSKLEQAELGHSVVDFFGDGFSKIETQIAAAIGCWAESDYMASWSMQTDGIGPIIAASLSAFIDIEKAPTVGHIWRFAGLDPTAKWDKGKKRPHCALLKVVCWKIRESWTKLKNKEGAEWPRRMFERKAQEWERNLAGVYSDQCADALKRRKFNEDGNAAKWYGGKVDPEWAREVLASGQPFPLKVKEASGGKMVCMLPPAHIHARAGRWAVKLWLSTWHAEAYRHTFGKEPPLPYPIAHLNHAHAI